jgi:hypothetical protein
MNRIIQRRGDATVAVLQVRLEQAEAEVARLRTALEEIVETYDPYEEGTSTASDIAHRALANEQEGK